MKTKTKFILLGILSFLVGSAFATPLLVSELEVVPFWTIPQGAKADLSISVAYANFTLQNDLPKYDVNVGEYLEANLDYSIVLNVTNLSDLPTKVSNFGFVGVKNTTITPSALGGFHISNQNSSRYSSSFIFSGPDEGYLGHVGTGRVEGLWLDGEWINTTWVPQGGLEEIWRSENIFPPKALEEVWEYNWYPYDTINFLKNMTSEFPDADIPPFVSYGGSRSNDAKQYYTRRGTIFTYEGENYWIEGVPLREYIADNEVKATLVYYNGSWIDATGMVKYEERPFVSASEVFMQVQLGFYGDSPYVEEDSSFPVGSYLDSSILKGFKFIYEFDNTWMPYQSRLILLSGSVVVDNSWNPDELLKASEVTVYMELVNYVTENIIDGVKVNTVSTSTELVPIRLERNLGSYLYDDLSLGEDSVFDLFDVEVFVLREAS